MNAGPAAHLKTAAPGYFCRRLPVITDLAALHARDRQRYPHLLTSAARGTPRSRHDILFAFPGDTLTLETDFRIYRNGQAQGADDFLEAFDREWRGQAIPPDDDATTAETRPPFIGGWFVFLGYELVSQIESTVTGIRREPAFPIACATRFPAAMIVDHVARQTLLVCEAERAADLMLKLEHDAVSEATIEVGAVTMADIQEESPERFLDNVWRIQEYIRAGDVFQVNLSRLWRLTLSTPGRPIDIYRRLCAANPAPFAGLMTWGNGRAVISSSPERLVEVRGTIVRTRPIAGTYPRSPDKEQDRILSCELLRHPKERAEHVMLIDLERNDLGRICRTGSVQVQDFMMLESYRHVHHIVSGVHGELRDNIGPAQVIRAVFPGGTITGCPKVRCMQIIAELERAPRTAYTGSMGYINRDGSLDLNILIRTIVQNGCDLQLRAGAGIVADSVPARELAETRAKAKGMLAALDIY